ncbi:hypothetical protein [Streptomyces alanosinicus]|uniref:hypothetical protein n=1 Tax=Streptomyces alanosinicus TaxID=68171 RepID=UPI001671E6F9
MIYMLSRLTRQGAAEALKIQEELARYGVAIVSTRSLLDQLTKSPRIRASSSVTPLRS